MALTVRQTTVGQAWITRPNRSLEPKHARQLILAAAGVTGAIAFVFAWFGAWPVIPFAGLEVAALWFALHYLQRRADDEERIDVSEASITVTRLVCGRQETHEFPRYWAQLQVENKSEAHGLRLFLRSHGREQEIGKLLTEEQKRAMAESLRKQLGVIEERNTTIPMEEGS